MEYEEAKTLLDQCERHELRDHAFGDMEVSWKKDGVEIAEGYYGGSLSDVIFAGTEGIAFTGVEARDLFTCGKLTSIERNDSTGPSEYKQGTTMPGLTVEGVHEEITHRNVFDQDTP